MKTYLEKNVYEAAIERLNVIFAEFDRIYLSFSGGKDSGLLLNLALMVAKLHNKLPLHVLYIDFEAQYQHTINYVERMLSNKDIEPYWVCLPLHLRNAVSQYQPHWVCWDDNAKEKWVRPLPNFKVINDQSYFPFFKKGMEFEDFVPAFGDWFAQGEKTACLVAIRSDESLNRYRTLKNTGKETYQGFPWSTKISESVFNFYPIYDWRTEDIWVANGKFDFDYNKIYDLMFLAGLSVHQMRLCQPYGDDQRKGLYLFKMLEPETWAKIVARVEGANFGNRYAGGKILGNFKIELPTGYTYKRYAKFLLNTMPPYLAVHYRQKIFKFLNWWKVNRKAFNLKRIPDFADSKLEASRKVPSWRRICKVLLKNDYWCKGLSFSQTKNEMNLQLALIAKHIEIK